MSIDDRFPLGLERNGIVSKPSRRGGAERNPHDHQLLNPRRVLRDIPTDVPTVRVAPDRTIASPCGVCNDENVVHQSLNRIGFDVRWSGALAISSNVRRDDRELIAKACDADQGDTTTIQQTVSEAAEQLEVPRRDFDAISGLNSAPPGVELGWAAVSHERLSQTTTRRPDFDQNAVSSHRASPPGAGVIVRLRKYAMEFGPGNSAIAPFAWPPILRSLTISVGCS
jgi:hypothetical protein